MACRVGYECSGTGEGEDSGLFSMALDICVGEKSDLWQRSVIGANASTAPVLYTCTMAWHGSAAKDHFRVKQTIFFQGMMHTVPVTAFST